MRYLHGPCSRVEMPPKDSQGMMGMMSPGKGKELGTGRGTCLKLPNKCMNKSDRHFHPGSRNPTLATLPVPPSWGNGLLGENGPGFVFMSSLWWWIIFLCGRDDEL